MTYSEFTYYSPTLDANVRRISMAGPLGEYYFLLPELDGKAYRARRDEALEAISTAIAQGCAPGRVLVR